jgi:hypothetical protein
VITVIVLLKSCATPPASCPIASIRWPIEGARPPPLLALVLQRFGGLHRDTVFERFIGAAHFVFGYAALASTSSAVGR